MLNIRNYSVFNLVWLLQLLALPANAENCASFFPTSGPQNFSSFSCEFRAMRSARQPLRSFNVYPNLTSRGATPGFANLEADMGAQTVRYVTDRPSNAPQFDFWALQSADPAYCSEGGRAFGRPLALWQHRIPIRYFDINIPFYRVLVGRFGLDEPLYLSLSEPEADAVQEIASAIGISRSFFDGNDCGTGPDRGRCSQRLGFVCFSGESTPFTPNRPPVTRRVNSQVNGEVLMVPTAFNSYAAKGRSLTPAAQTYSWQSCVGRLSTACSVLTTNFNAYPDISVYLNNVQANPRADFPGMYRRFILYTPQPNFSTSGGVSRP